MIHTICIVNFNAKIARAREIWSLLSLYLRAIQSESVAKCVIIVSLFVQ